MSEDPSPDTIANLFALFTPFLLLGGLALLGGGFDLESRHLAGILAWIAVGVVLATPFGRRTRLGSEYRLIASLILGLAVLAAVSSLWSDAVSRSLVEAERAIAYLGFLTLAYLACQTERQRRNFFEGLVLALGLILLLALSDRLFPGAGPIPAEEGARLRFPLGYWNADGLVFGISVVLLSWMGRHGSRSWFRWIALMLLPAAVVGLYLTYSRGGFVAAGISFLCVFFLSRDRLWLASVTSIGVICAVPVLKLVRASPAIAENLGGATAPAEGREVALALILAMLLCAALGWGLIRTGRRWRRPAARALGMSRTRGFVAGCALLAVLGLAAAAVLFGPRAWDSYTQGPLHFPDRPAEHLTQLSSNGRYDQNRVAVEAFLRKPITGIGAGTFRFEWARERPIDLVVQDGHSFYLEAFAETGIIGGLLTLALMASVVGIGVVALRRSRAETRERTVAALAVSAALAAAFAIDWFWELGATAALLMAIAAFLAAQAEASSKLQALRPSPGQGSRRAVAGAIAAWAAIIVLLVPLLAARAIEQSAAASAAGRVTEAVEKAREAQSLDPWSPAPHLQLGVIAQSLGMPKRSIAEFTEAIRLEPLNWRSWYLRMLARIEAGSPSRAISHDYREALHLNPRAPELQTPPAPDPKAPPDPGSP